LLSCAPTRALESVTIVNTTIPIIDFFTTYLLSSIPEIDEIVLEDTNSHTEPCRPTHAPFGYRFGPGRTGKNNTPKTAWTIPPPHRQEATEA
jgi:hypothetical protein